MDSHTLIQALIYLGSAALIVPIAVRLGLGSVRGYLIAGCVIGPWGLRLVTDAEAILHFAEIGVVLMLFVIGLELDPQRLWKLRASVFGGGALQMVVCGAFIGLFCMLLGLRWQVAELIGMTLALSSTAIAMQAMNERNLTVTQLGRSAFAVLLFQDIAAIPLVAMIPLLAASGGSTTLAAFALSALKVAGALALVVLLGRYLTRPVLRFVARSGLREVFSAVALFLVNRFWVGRRSYVTITGKEISLNPFPVPKWVKWTLFTLTMLISLFVLLVYGTLFYGAFTKTWGYDWSFTWENLQYVFLKGEQIWNSIKYGLLASLGAALLAKNGSVYTGCNIECASFTPTNCAERTALFKAVSEGVHEFAAVAVVGAKDSAPDDALVTSPCGVCRQMLYEFGGPDLRVIMAKSENDWREMTLGELLPLGFGPEKVL